MEWTVRRGCSVETASPGWEKHSTTLLVAWLSVLNVPLLSDRLAGLVVRRPPRERKVPGSNPACAGIFSGLSHTSDLKIGTPVATLPDAWRYRVITGTGWPGVSIILWLGEAERLICNFYLKCGSTSNCLSRSVPEIHLLVAGTLSNQPTNKQTSLI